MNKIDMIVDQTIEIVQMGELKAAKLAMIDYANGDNMIYPFITGLVFGKLHQIDKELCHSFMKLFHDEMSEWYPHVKP